MDAWQPGAAGWQLGGKRFNLFLLQICWHNKKKPKPRHLDARVLMCLPSLLTRGKSMMLGGGVGITGALATVGGGPMGSNEVRMAELRV
eukprot:4647976-Ditylum_brightwellii.AAC.1